VFTAGSLSLLALGRPVASALLFGFGMFVIFVADHFIRPALISGSTRLPFLLVLLGILGRLERFGVIGLFVGPKVMAVLIALWREWVKASPARDLATGRHYLAAGADD
jgi:predicted PurR-regulated permease PerM